MDFSWGPEQVEIHEHVLRFARDVLGDAQPEVFDRRAWGRCAEIGLQGLCGPKTHGGMGLDALTTAYALEALGQGTRDTGLAFSIAAHLFACVMPIAEWGSDELKDRILRGLCAGSTIGANAITEAEAGSDIFSLRTKAVLDGDHYLLTGSKNYVTNGPEADVLLVYASTNPKHKYMGLTAFVVERGTPGMILGAKQEKIGLNSSSIGSIYFDQARIPVANRVGQEGQGALIFNSSMVWERACLFAIYIGAMARQLETSVAYANMRRQFGKPISANQAVSHRLVNMKVRMESARLLLYRTCWLHTQGKSTPADIAMSKLAVSEAAVESAMDAIRVHGGIGVLREGNVECDLGNAIPATVFSGTSDIQRNLIARGLGL